VVGTRREAGITGETTEEMTEGMIGDKIEAEITEMIEETTEEEATEMEDGTLTIAGTMRTIILRNAYNSLIECPKRSNYQTAKDPAKSQTFIKTTTINLMPITNAYRCTSYLV
jgi:hypothetical protein